MMPNIKVSHVRRPPNQHGGYCQIPEAYINREIVTVVRNPYARFLSTYQYQWWKKNPPVPPNVLEEHFPSFPALSLDDFVRLDKLSVLHSGFVNPTACEFIGNQTVQFVHMFFKDPKAVLRTISDAYINSDEIFADIAPITFLQQELLNEQLARFVEGKGYKPEEVAYVRERSKVNVTVNEQACEKGLWTQSALDYVEKGEQMIFRILGASGISYRSPAEL